MAESPSKRLVSLDVFRGATIAGMMLVNNPGTWGHIYSQLDHAEWNGWTFTDLIFPFFLFITGVSIVLSRAKSADQPKAAAYLKILKRAAILFALGLFLNGFPYYDLSALRIMGVLQRIALCFGLAAILHMEMGLIGESVAAVALLFLYWALMALYPVPGVGAGVLEKGRNFAAYIDSMILGSHMWANAKTWDPEGLVSTLPAISTTLFGVLTGRWLRTERGHESKARGMLVAGLVGMAIGQLWSFALPINKNLWTSSYAVFMSGFALVVLSACYYAIEAKGSKAWTLPFEVFGLNSITVFAAAGILARITILWKIPFHGKERVLKGVLYEVLFASWLSPINASLAYAVAFLLVLYAMMCILYKRRIFLKV